jgi:hypothetical protein
MSNKPYDYDLVIAARRADVALRKGRKHPFPKHILLMEKQLGLTWSLSTLKTRLKKFKSDDDAEIFGKYLHITEDWFWLSEEDFDEGQFIQAIKGVKLLKKTDPPIAPKINPKSNIDAEQLPLDGKPDLEQKIQVLSSAHQLDAEPKRGQLKGDSKPRKDGWARYAHREPNPFKFENKWEKGARRVKMAFMDILGMDVLETSRFLQISDHAVRRYFKDLHGSEDIANELAEDDLHISPEWLWLSDEDFDRVQEEFKAAVLEGQRREGPPVPVPDKSEE